MQNQKLASRSTTIDKKVQNAKSEADVPSRQAPKHLLSFITRVVQNVLSLIGLLSFILSIF